MKDLVLIEEAKAKALEAFSSDEGLDSMVQEAKDFVANFEPDTTTAKGRAEITSLASKVSKFKNRLDDLGKDLVADWKSKSKAVDQNRKNMRDALDELKKTARLPLTQWEEEQARIKQEQADREAAEQLAKQFESDHEMGLLLNEKYDREAADERERVEREQREEQERQNNARREEEERQEQEAQAEADRKEQARLDQIEADRVAELNNKMLVFTNYQTVAVRLATVEEWKAALVAVQAIEMTVNNWAEFLPQAVQARAEAETGIKENIAERKKYDEDQAELKRLKDEADEREKQEEIERQEQVKKDQETAKAQEKAENKEHRRKINSAAADALVAAGLSEEDAVKAVTAIAMNEIPNVTINY